MKAMEIIGLYLTCRCTFSPGADGEDDPADAEAPADAVQRAVDGRLQRVVLAARQVKDPRRQHRNHRQKRQRCPAHPPRPLRVCKNNYIYIETHIMQMHAPLATRATHANFFTCDKNTCSTFKTI